MHTFISSDGVCFKYNPDLSDVRVNIVPSDIEDISHLCEYGHSLCEVTISGEALLEFVAEYIKREMINDLEQISPKDILRESFTRR